MAKKKTEDTPVVETAPEVVATPSAEIPTPDQMMQAKIQEVSKKVNEYLEAAGLELRVIHTISLVPKQQK